ncbi:amino acid adenylation domain-containing protein [Micromonospora sp. NPDC049274]|uniref:amino acid adenylation domain-containing protein n=1 Tax=Micromonospora sp. NPDC049274 TaxID=3154829 RepID=UPI00343CDDA7
MTGAQPSTGPAYWRDHLAGASTLDLVTDRVRPARRRNRIEQIPLTAGRDTARRLIEVSSSYGVPPLAPLLAVGQVVLGRRTGTRDVMVGTLVAGALVALRTRWADDPSAAELFARVATASRAAVAHADVPLARVAEALGLPPDPSRAVLCPVVLAQDAVPATGDVPVDLTVSWGEPTADGLSGVIGYDPDLFDRATIRRFSDHYLTLLDNALATPEAAVSTLAHTCAGERALLAAWGTGESSAEASEVPAAFLARADATPDAIAVEFDGVTLTYAEVRARADALAAAVGAHRITPGGVVGLAMAPSADLVVAMLAVLAAGAAYLPLDPVHPPERQEYMLRDSDARLLIADGAVDFAGDLPVLRVDRPLPPVGRTAADRPRVHPAQRAAVFYTSGSTGRPKGAEVTHGGIVRLARDAGYVSLGPADVVAQVANVSFDAATFEVWGALLNGARLVGVAKDDALTPARLGDRLAAHGVTTMFLTTALFNRCVDADPAIFAPLRSLIFGGEAADARRVAALCGALPGLRLVHAYGPTECTTFAATWDVTDLPGDAVRVPIGRPVGGTRLYVLDDHGRQAGVGVPGELHIGGAGLAHGYLGRPDLTAERFVPSPFEPGERLYRTGDVVRWREDGQLEFLSRVDNQVKIRGIRIEPDEVAGALAACPGIREAFVDVRGDGDARRLVAYVVPVGDPIPAGQLRAHLAARLPEAMVPAWYVPLAVLPLNANGKVDRAGLPEPAARHGVRGVGGVAPHGPVEELVARTWREMLGVPVESADDDFFALGGHSLLAAQMVARVAAGAGVELGVRAVFEAPTVAALAARIAGARHGEARPPVPVAGDKGPHPLSYAQQRLWFLDRLDPEQALYSVPLVFTIDGPLDVEALDASLCALVRRHAALRTRLVTIDGEPRQVIDDQPSVVLAVHDLRGADCGDGHADALLRRATAEPFDLATGPLARWLLVRLSDRRCLLLVVMHHAVFDGGSVGVLIRDLGALYTARTTAAPTPAPLTVDYPGYTRWQRDLLAGPARAEQLTYWVDQLGGAPAALDLPTDRPRPATLRHVGETFDVRLSAAILERLDEVARRHGVTRFMVLLAAFQLLLGRYADVRDVSVGSPVAGRTRPEFDDLIGFFVNTVVLRARWRDTDTFADLLARARDTVLGAYEHQDVPFEQVVEAVRPPRDPSRTPLFQVMLSAQNVPASTDAFPGLSVAVAEPPGRVAKFDLTVAWEEVPTAEGELRGIVEYDVDLFDRDTAERMAYSYRALLDSALAAPDMPVATLDLLPGPEPIAPAAPVVAAAHPTPASGGATARTEGDDGRPLLSTTGATVHGLVGAAAGRWADRPAVVQGGRTLSHAELAARAAAVHAHLASRAVRPGDTVAVLLDRTLDWPAALLGVLSVGAAYVPLDPSIPRERLAYVLADSAAVLVLGSRAAGPPDTAVPFTTVEDAFATAASAVPVPVHPSASAYVLYTSGTTGLPKGVLVSHGNLVHTLEAVARHYALTPADRVLQFAALTFDVAAEELFATLIRGGTVVLPPVGPVPGLDELTALADRERLTVLNLPASYWHEWVAALDRHPVASCPYLRLVVVGSERVDAGRLAQWRTAAPHVRWLNAYGPTETTITATVHEPCGDREGVSGTVSIGRPLPGVRAYVLDGGLRPVPRGVPGDLWLGGPGVAQGYVNDPARTATSFVPDPWGPPGARMYGTRDRVRLGAAGVLEFLGRNDDQIKLRGFRIELGEVEAALGTHPRVVEAAAMLREDVPGRPTLVGYVTPLDVDVAALRAHLADRLPGYMVPAVIVPIDRLPRGESGKVDRGALPPPPTQAPTGDTVPGGDLERTVAAIWRDVLTVEHVGAEDNFFDIGGHSLLVVRVQARLAERLGRPVPIVDLFRHPTVRALARHLATGEPPSVPSTGQHRAETRRTIQRERPPRRRPGGPRHTGEA